jgi:hypothetical protein
MDKIGIARRQIHGAIRAYYRDDDPLVVTTLVLPASQILRDLNIGNASAISNLFSELCRDNNYPIGKFWTAFNDSTGANKIKHGKDQLELLDFESIKRDQEGAICFSILEYYSRNDRTVSPYMYSFMRYIERKAKRASWPSGIRIALEKIDRRVSAHFISLKLRLLFCYLEVLVSMQRRIDPSKATPPDRSLLW